MSEYILTCNAGSNSLKSALYAFDGAGVSRVCRFLTDRIHNNPEITVEDKGGNTVERTDELAPGYQSALSWILSYLETEIDDFELAAVGHRIVHGGSFYDGPVRIDGEVVKKLESLVPFAPTHQPHNLALIEALGRADQELTQVACFDTSFHTTQSREAKQFALPQDLVAEHGLYRYGFHGLSYEYIAAAIKKDLAAAACEHVVALHLGSGVSGCAMKNGKSVSTTMGLTALDGLMMSTRPGTLDPGVILYLIKDAGLDVDEVEEILYKKSGLLGVSGISRDMRDLDENDAPRAVQAVALFCAMAARQTASLVADLGGLDALVFTGAMGANDAIIRKKICGRLSWMGLTLDDSANDKNNRVLSAPDSRVKILAVPTDEEVVIARKTYNLIHENTEFI